MIEDQLIPINERQMSQEFLYTPEFKLFSFGEGEWVNEPDKVTFTHLGIKCEIIRIITPNDFNHYFRGYFCGYCYCPLELKVDDFEIHGGITYDEIENDGQRKIGFDCGHSNDLIPSMKYLFENNSDLMGLPKYFARYLSFKRIYKNIEFAIEQCTNLANQIIKSKEKNESII